MSRFLGIALTVSTLMVAAYLYAMVEYTHNSREEFEALRLSIQLNYATDAGADAMLETDDLNMDYANNRFFNADPELALDNFLVAMALGYDMAPSEANKRLLREYIPVASVSTFDGFYLATQQLIGNGQNFPENNLKDVDYDLKFGVKMPYTYSYNNAQYALTMGMDYTWKIDGSSLTKDIGLPPKNGGYLNELEAWNIITSSISNDMAYAIESYNDNNYGWSNRFYIPSQLTETTGTNSISGPSFIVLVQGLDLTLSKSVDGFSVAGSRVDNVRMVAAYTRNNIKYYTYADKLPIGISIDDLYTTTNEAAKAGYFADQKYLQ